MKFHKQKVVATLVKSPVLGIKTKTLFDVAGLMARIKTGKVNKERLRNVQFNLLADVFMKQLKSKDINLAIFFTNHIAANMHRYWYGLFPEDYSLKLYDEAWIDKYSSENLISVEFLDAFLGKIMSYCQQTRKTSV